jgi:type I restriction enzyme S subunit
LPEVICGYHLSIIRATAHSTGRFLKYVFLSDPTRYYFEISAKGLTRVGLSQGALGNTPIPKPPRREQEIIANFLDHETARIDALIEEQQRLIDLLQEKHQAVISHAVTKGLDPDVRMKDTGIQWLNQVPAHWEVIQLRRVLERDVLNGLYKPESEKSASGIPVVQMGEAFGDRVFVSGAIDRVEATKREIGQWGLKEGDLLFARRSIVQEGSGRCTRIGNIKEPHLFESSMIRVRLDPRKALPKYTHFAFDSRPLRAQTLATTKTVTISGIDGSQLKSLYMPLPPISEQEAIADHLEASAERIAAISEEASRTIEVLQERRAALISAAVTGKIDVRDWDPENTAEEEELPIAAEPEAPNG